MGIKLPEPEKLRDIFSALGFVTTGTSMSGVLQCAYKASHASDTTVLLQGETGTGKQVLARAIHALDEKRGRFPFVTVHCSTISESLAESELFGHRKGSFSGAVSARSGLFQAAERGTVFLDDVNDLPLRLQPKLLDALQRGSIRPLGSDREQHVDVRIIAAANRQLEPLVAQGEFRADLYHRLNVIKVNLPPLRERDGDDLAALVLEFAHRYPALYQRIESLDPELLQYLKVCRFEGNVRELENAVQRMLFLKNEGDSLTRADWLRQEADSATETQAASDIPAAANLLWLIMVRNELPFPELMRKIEGELLRRALQVSGKTRREIAQLLQTSERTLYHKMSAHGIGGSKEA
ncbi:sigma-54 specific transcriptional regulator, Fis family [Candidatus Koribacter versatilis Ellin345]|uniref:Sigma-54 specific transcriptional regulator, Fis family n=1 Tax=Koribacter versatilis (strain Ellin345) TaxID=204669 RepID=Q1ITC9_KORVE|nr:sigma 54-interacting transcriptional regulator [Candidatus Koribacter versatilis]ABF39871.1 sigma-54 specific transcriptional regulator, Fis family [Candidatus Koribacter versatilis Ellin345]